MQAARAHASEMEEQAQEETVGAEEAYLLLGDAEVTVSHSIACMFAGRPVICKCGCAKLSEDQALFCDLYIAWLTFKVQACIRHQW